MLTGRSHGLSERAERAAMLNVSVLRRSQVRLMFGFLTGNPGCFLLADTVLCWFGVHQSQ